MPKVILTALACATVSIPLMYLIALIDPIRESISLRTYSISFLSLVGTYLLIVHFVKKGKSEQLSRMRSDGLSDDEIISIVGEAEYQEMCNF